MAVSSDASTPLTGIVRTVETDFGWALIPTPGGQNAHFGFRSYKLFVQTYWATRGTQFVVAAFIVLWLVLWGALSAGGLISRSRNQNRILRELLNNLRWRATRRFSRLRLNLNSFLA